MSKFQQRHYEAIANEIHKEVQWVLSSDADVIYVETSEGDEYIRPIARSSLSISTLTNLVERISDMFGEDNPHFSKKKFEDACGL